MQADLFKDRTAIVTGGARGIGLATATAMSREGMKVAIGDLDGALAAEQAAKLGGEAVGLQLDVTDRDSFANFLDEVEEIFRTFPPAQLGERRNFQGRNLTVLDAVFHVVEHFSMHLGQVILVAKMRAPDHINP